MEGASVRIDWGYILILQDHRGADLAFLDQVADGLLPSSTGGVVVEDGVGVAEEPGVEVAHCTDWDIPSILRRIYYGYCMLIRQEWREATIYLST